MRAFHHCCGGLLWFVHTAPSARAGTIDPSVVVVTCVTVPQATQERDWGGTQWRSGQLLASPECLGMPDGFLIDCSGSLSPLPPPMVSQVCSGGTYLLDSLQPNRLLLLRLRFWIYEWKSSRVEFLASEGDNGRDSMKQFVTSSLPLTFTGCWSHRGFC